METILFVICFKVYFSSYPTYEEWKLLLRSDKMEKIIVLILPMRNGNIPTVKINMVTNIFCSYPTYEEWKPMNLKNSQMNKIVLILPMRNGNNKWIDSCKKI